MQSEIFVYNLGTMFYIDHVLYAEQLSDALNSLPASTTPRVRTVTPSNHHHHQHRYTTLAADVESVSETATNRAAGSDTGTSSIDIDDEDDDILHDDEIVTPRVLPVKYKFNTPK